MDSYLLLVQERIFQNANIHLAGSINETYLKMSRWVYESPMCWHKTLAQRFCLLFPNRTTGLFPHRVPIGLLDTVLVNGGVVQKGYTRKNVGDDAEWR